MSEMGTGGRRKAAVAIEDLRVVDYHDYPMDVATNANDLVRRWERPATLADLISVLEGLGAERVESHWAYDYEGEQTALFVDEPGSYIVWRIEEKK